MKQALANQGITGEERSLTERVLWMQKEKEALVTIMLKHGIEWEQKGEHKAYISVLGYKQEGKLKKLLKEAKKTFSGQG